MRLCRLAALCGLATVVLGLPAPGDAQLRRIAPGGLAVIGGGGNGGPRCAWPFIVDVDDQNIAYPDPNATYWAIPLELAANETLTLQGTYPSARFMAVTLYTATGDTLAQLSDFEITPDPGSVNPYADAAPPPEAGRRWQVSIVPSGGQTSAPNVLELEPGQTAGWILYRVYLGNPSGDRQGSAPLPTVVRRRNGQVTQTLPPCKQFLPGTAIADLLSAVMPEPVLVTGAPQFIRFPDTNGLFANEANAYLTALSDAPPGEILVIRGKVPTTPDTELGQSVVGDFQMRYFSITSNLNQKPYPTVDGIYDAQLPRDADGVYTVVVARDDDVPRGSNDVYALLAWGDGDSQAVIVRNMLPDSSFPNAIQDVTPSPYGAPSDAEQVMREYYPRIVACPRAVFETQGADACFAAAP